MIVIELTKGKTVHLRPALGEDEILAWRLRGKMEPFLVDRGEETTEIVFQAEFAICMIVTERVEGFEFTVPKPEDDGGTIAEAYRAFVRLPRHMFNAWRRGPNQADEAANAPDLLPKEKVPEVTRENPLSKAAVEANAKR